MSGRNGTAAVSEVVAGSEVRRRRVPEAPGRPRRLSFAAAVQSTAASWQVIVLTRDSVAAGLSEAAQADLSDHTVGDRPGRVEPRAAKRRPKPYDLLTKPGDLARADLLVQKWP